MPRRYPPPEDPRDEVIRQLRSDLWMARHDIIELFRSRVSVHEVLTGYYRCDDQKKRGKWIDWAVEMLLQAAEPKPGRDMGDHLQPYRAYCPLCGEGAQSPFVRGFAFPTGLEWRLLGTHSARQCRVFRAADQMCLDHVRDHEKNPRPPRPLAEERPAPWDRPPPPAPPKPNAQILEFKARGKP